MQNRTQKRRSRTTGQPGHLARAKGFLSVRPGGHSAGHPDKAGQPDTLQQPTAGTTSAGLAAGELEVVGCVPASAPRTPDTLPLVGRPASGVVGSEANTHAARTAAHKARLAADPRFAAWQHLDATPAAHDPRPAAVEAGLRLDPFAEEGAECDSTEKTQPRPVEQP